MVVLVGGQRRQGIRGLVEGRSGGADWPDNVGTEIYFQ